MKKKILLVGFGGHSRSCIDVIDNTNNFKIIGYVEKNKRSKIHNTNLRKLGYDEDLSVIFKHVKYAHISIGQMKNLELRKNIFQKLINIGFKMPTIISKKSIISKKNVNIGDGTIIMNNVTINCNTTIGENCIINTGSIIEHDCNIKSHTHIAPGTIVNGSVRIGKQSFIGAGSVIKQNKVIKQKSFYPMISKIL